MARKPLPPTVTARRSRKTRRLGGRDGSLRFNFGRSLFVLPNLFTVTSIFCGFYAILLASGAGGAALLPRACLAIFFAIFFDMADGRVARLTRTQSAFGVQLDSLADVISFGVAPAVLLYRWSLTPLGLGGVALAFVYIACGAIRLARFNVIAERGDKSGGAYFIGLPIPLAAGMIASSILVQQRLFGAAAPRIWRGVVLVTLLASLMVSNVRYRTFKQTQISAASLSAFFTLLGCFVAVALRFTPPVACLLVFGCYTGLGLLEASGRTVRRLGRRLGARGEGRRP